MPRQFRPKWRPVSDRALRARRGLLLARPMPEARALRGLRRNQTVRRVLRPQQRLAQLHVRELIQRWSRRHRLQEPPAYARPPHQVLLV